MVTPIWTPLLELLRDKSFVTVLIGALFSTLALAIPSLEPLRATLVPLIVVFVVALVGGQVAENSTKTLADAKVKVAQAQVDVARIQSAAVAQTARLAVSPPDRPFHPADEHAPAARG